MDKNSVIGLTLIFVLFALYFWWIKPSSKHIDNIVQNDTVMMSQQSSDTANMISNTMDVTDSKDSASFSPDSDSARKVNSINQFGVFASASNGQQKYYTVKTPKLEIVFSNLGGKIFSVTLPEFKTYDSLPLLLFKGNENVFGLTFFSNNRLINTDKLYFVLSDSVSEPIVVTNSNGYDFSMKLFPEIDGQISTNKYIEYTYHIPYDDYMIDVNCNIIGMQDIIYSSNGFVDLLWSVNLLQQEKDKVNRLNGTTVFYQYEGDDADKLTENKDGEKKLSVKTHWVSYKQQFFASSLIASGKDCFLSGNISSMTNPNMAASNGRYIKTMSSQLSMPYYGNVQDTFNMKMYFGPNKFKVLNKYDLGLERQINIGNFFLVRWINRGIMFVFNFLDQFHWNYGIVILVLTLLLKLLLSPITYKSYLSSAKMRALKPEMDAIAAKYPNQDDAMKKQQATMEMYKKFGVSPMSGCLPMLLQFPILIAMFRFFPVSFELRQQAFLWAKDLSTYDSIWDLPFKIPFYGDHVSLFTLLMTVSTILYTIMNNKTMGQENQPGMKFMTYVMPILFLGIFNSYSAGLSYYYLLFNLITFAQTYIIGKIQTPEKLRAQIMLNAAKNDKKPKNQKSRWQKKLEELEKMQREQVKKNANSKKRY